MFWQPDDQRGTGYATHSSYILSSTRLSKQGQRVQHWQWLASTEEYVQLFQLFVTTCVTTSYLFAQAKNALWDMTGSIFYYHLSCTRANLTIEKSEEQSTQYVILQPSIDKMHPTNNLQYFLRICQFEHGYFVSCFMAASFMTHNLLQIFHIHSKKFHLLSIRW